MFLGCPSAYGETNYSDEWVDDSDPSQGYVVGAGVTDGSYTHEYYVTAHMDEFTGIKVCSYVQRPIVGGAREETYCQDVVFASF